MLTYIHHLKDERVKCYSILMKIEVKEYLKFIESVYRDKGKIEGQRSPLKTKSAQRIRKRLIEDLARGTVIPPIVLGIKLEEDQFNSLENDIPDSASTILDNIDIQKQVSIIDGMQRTTALYETSQRSDFNEKAEIRIELWVAQSTNSLIYRMLVLNSGQIPWNIKRQLEVVFSQLKKELETNINGLELYTSEEVGRRVKAGQYQASQFIELFMLFGTKRVNIDIQEELTEEFARLDIIETSGNEEFMKMFQMASQNLVHLDQIFSKVTLNDSEIVLNKFKIGKDIFSSQPARAGFIVAISQEIFGLPGVEYNTSIQKEKYEIISSKLNILTSKLKEYSLDDLADFIDLPTLDEQLNFKSSKVGEFERNFFLKSFKTMLELIKVEALNSFTPCWRSSH